MPHNSKIDMDDAMSNDDNHILPPFLASIALKTIPQDTFSKADQLFLQATNLEKQAEELARRLEDTRKQVQELRATGYDLQRLATQDRAQVQAEMQLIMEEFKDVIPEFTTTTKRSQALSELIMNVADGTAVPELVLSLRRELTSFRNSCVAELNVVKEAESYEESPSKIRKRLRFSISDIEQESDSDSDSERLTTVPLKKKLKTEDFNIHEDSSMEIDCSVGEADEADGESEAESETTNRKLTTVKEPSSVHKSHDNNASTNKNRKISFDTPNLHKDSDHESEDLGPIGQLTLQKAQQKDSLKLNSKMSKPTAKYVPTGVNSIPISKGKKHKSHDSPKEKVLPTNIHPPTSVVETKQIIDESKLSKRERKQLRKAKSVENLDSKSPTGSKHLDAKRQAALKAQKDKHYRV